MGAADADGAEAGGAAGVEDDEAPRGRGGDAAGAAHFHEAGDFVAGAVVLEGGEGFDGGGGLGGFLRGEGGGAEEQEEELLHGEWGLNGAGGRSVALGRAAGSAELGWISRFRNRN